MDSVLSHAKALSNVSAIALVGVTIGIALLLARFCSKTTPRPREPPTLKTLPAKKKPVPGTLEVPENENIPSTPWRAGGDTPDIAKAISLSYYLKELHESYNEDIVQFWLSDQLPIVAMRDSEHLHQMQPVSSRMLSMFQFTKEFIFEDNLQISNGERAKQLRRALMVTIGPTALHGAFEDTLKMAQEKVARWKMITAGGDKVMAQREMLDFSLATASRVLGANPNLIDPDMFHEAYSSVWPDSQKIFYGLPLSDERRAAYYKWRTWITDLWEILIADRAENGGGSPGDMIDVLLTGIDPCTGERWTRQSAKQHLGIFLMAAYHTTSAAISWMIYTISQRPALLKKLQNEVDSLFGDGVYTTQKLSQMTYWYQTMKETIRTQSPATLMARQLETDMVFGDKKLLKGTGILVSLPAVHKNPKYWDNPEEFDPDRFADSSSLHSHQFIPFGFGSRICPGERLAWWELRLFFAVLLRECNLDLLMNPADLVLVDNNALFSRDDVPIRVTSRTN